MIRVFVSESPEKADLDTCLGLLSPERRERILRAQNESIQKQSAAAELLLRYALRSVFGMDDLPQIALREGGKPYFPTHPEIRFNLSHCPLAAACAVADTEVGVDVQDVRPVSDAVLRRVLCENEQAFVQNAADKNTAFAILWSRKEAILKMQGSGIASDLSALDVSARTDVTTQIFGRYVVSACCAAGESCRVETVDLF